MNRSSHTLVCLGALAALAASAGAGVRLTDVFQFSTFANGQPFGGQLWDTEPGPTFGIWLSVDGVPINGVAPTTDAGIDVELTPGSYAFQMWGAVGSAGLIPHAGMNLFFGDSPTAGISVVAEARSDMGHVPVIMANDFARTPTPAGNGPASGALSYFDADSGLTVSLVDYFYANPQVFNDDQVQGFDRVPGGGPDFYGEFTLRVIPAPASGLAIVGMAVHGLRRRR